MSRNVRPEMSAPAHDTVPASGERLLDAVLDAAASLIVVVTAKGELVRWNRACERLTGYVAAELMRPQAMLRLVPEEEQKQLVEVRAALARGESPVSLDLHWRMKSGELRQISWSNTALTAADGTVTHVVATGIDVTEARALEGRLRRLADHDALTGLLNRRRFGDLLERHVAMARRYGMEGALLVLDVDSLKAVNDTHGHRAGDRALAAVAGVLKQRLRATDVVARTGGDEFAVLLPKATPKDAERICRSLERSISEHVTTPGGLPLKTSVGYAPFSENVRSIDEVFSAADASMYAIKAGHSRTPREPAPVG